MAFKRALESANRGGNDVKRTSTAMESARELAGVCRKHGLHQQAEALDAQAAAIEALAMAPPAESQKPS